MTRLFRLPAATKCNAEVDDAAFAYVGVFKTHGNVGFFNGAELTDPAGLLVCWKNTLCLTPSRRWQVQQNS